jgi:hypothetical protein
VLQGLSGLGLDRGDAGADLLELRDAGLQHAHPGVALRRERRRGLLGRGEGLGQRTVQLLGHRAEMVARGALHEAEAVLELLADLERHLVDVTSDDELRLLLPPGQTRVHVLAVGAAPHQDAGEKRQRVDERHADEPGDQPHHEHAAVGTADADVDLLARAELARIEAGDLLDRVEDAPGVAHVDRGERRLAAAEHVRDFLGQPHRAFVRPDERLGDGRGDALVEPFGYLVPDGAGIALVDRLLRLAHHTPEPVSHVVLHVGDEIGDAVGERDLPAGGAPAELVGARLGRLELGDHARGVLGVLQGVQLGAHRQRQLVDHREQIVNGAAFVDRLGAAEHLAAQMRHEGGEAGIVVEAAVLGLGGEQPQIARDGEDRHVAGIQQVAAVDLLHLAPFRVEVGLGEHGGHVRRDAHGMTQELHLGLGVLLRRVGHHQHGVRRREGGERGQRVGGFQTADAGRIDQLQAALEDLARQQHLGRDDPAFVARVAALRDVVGELFEGDLAAFEARSQRVSAAVPAPLDDPRRGLRRVADDRGHAGGDVIVDRTRRSVDQRIDELALALLELADDDDSDARIEQPIPGLLQALREVGSACGCREAADLADAFCDRFPSGAQFRHVLPQCPVSRWGGAPPLLPVSGSAPEVWSRCCPVQVGCGSRVISPDDVRIHFPVGGVDVLYLRSEHVHPGGVGVCCGIRPAGRVEDGVDRLLCRFAVTVHLARPSDRIVCSVLLCPAAFQRQPGRAGFLRTRCRSGPRWGCRR